MSLLKVLVPSLALLGKLILVRLFLGRFVQSRLHQQLLMLNFVRFCLIATSWESFRNFFKGSRNLSALTQSISLSLLIVLIDLVFELNL